MPKIFGTSLLGILAATIAFYLLGYLWFGVLFTEMWLTFAGISEADALAQSEKMGVMMYVGGIIITFLQVLGLAYVIQHASASVLLTCVKICAVIALLISLPIMMYSHLYEGASHQSIILGFAHTFIGYILVGLVLSFFRGKDAIGE